MFSLLMRWVAMTQDAELTLADWLVDHHDQSKLVVGKHFFFPCVAFQAPR